MRIGVIGAGLMGATAAYHLTRLRARVTIIDPHSPGRGTSGSTFGWVNASTPEIADPHYFRLCVAAITEHASLCQQAPPGTWFHPSGHLRWANADGVDALLAHANQLNEAGYPVTILTGAQAAEAEPAIRFASPLQPVVSFPGESWVDGTAMACDLVSAATAQGARALIGSHVVAVEDGKGSGLTVVLGNRTTQPFDAVVNAAGPWSDSIAALVGRELPLRPSPGLVARLSVPRVPVRHALHSPQVEIRPDGPHRILLHSRKIDAQLRTGIATPDQRAELAAMATEVIPALADSTVTDSSVGWRPMPSDTWPSVGNVPGVGGYYELVSHLGITLAPLLGRLLAEEIMTGQVSPLLSPYRPERPTLLRQTSGAPETLTGAPSLCRRSLMNR